MTATNQAAYIYNTHSQVDYDAFDKAVRILGEPKKLENGFIAFSHCSTSHSTVGSFDFATRDTNTSTTTFIGDRLFLNPELSTARDLHEDRLVPSMLVLGQVGTAIRKVVVGKITDLTIKFYAPIKVGDDLQIEVERSDSKAVESWSRVYFFVRVSGKVVAEGGGNIDKDQVETEQVNPFFAAGLFSALIDTRLPGSGSLVCELRINFDGSFLPGMPLRTIGTVAYVEPRNGPHHLDLFCLSSCGMVAHAEATVVKQQRRK